MSFYQRFPIETDPAALATQAYDTLSTKTGGVWQPADGNLDTWIVEVCARMAAEVRDVAADVPDTIFRTFGERLVGLPPIEPQAAQAIFDVGIVDGAGYLIPQGTNFAVDDLAGTPHAFATQEPITLEVTTGPRVVQIVTYAVEAGAAASGIAPRAGNAYLLDALSFVTSVDLAETTSGGSDGESDDDYMSRLAAWLTLLSPAPILPRDFAVMALQVPGVGFAAAINLYDPGPPVNTNAARTVSVAVADENGEPCSADVKADVDELLQSHREVNFQVFVIDPAYLVVNVTFTIAVVAGFDAASIVQACEDALTSFLEPANFAGPDGGEIAGLWTPQAAVRYLDIGLVIAGVDGVDHVVSYTVNGGTVDVALPTPAGLPRPGTITGTAA